MTQNQKDESPETSEGPYWSEELLAVLMVGLGDETAAALVAAVVAVAETTMEVLEEHGELVTGTSC